MTRTHLSKATFDDLYIAKQQPNADLTWLLVELGVQYRIPSADENDRLHDKMRNVKGYVEEDHATRSINIYPVEGPVEGPVEEVMYAWGMGTPKQLLESKVLEHDADYQKFKGKHVSRYKVCDSMLRLRWNDMPTSIRDYTINVFLEPKSVKP